MTTVIQMPKLDPNAPSFLRFLGENMPENILVQPIFPAPDSPPSRKEKEFEHALWGEDGVAIASAWHPNYLLVIGEKLSWIFQRLAEEFERQHPDIEVTLEVIS